MAFEPIVLTPRSSLRWLLGVLVLLCVAPIALVGGIVGKIIAVAVFGGYVALSIKLSRARIIVTIDGVEHRGAFSTKKLRWDEVRRYRFVSIDPTANAHAAGGGLIGALAIVAVKAMQAKGGNRKFKAGRLTLFGDGNHKVVITSRFKGADAALDVAFAQLHPRLANTTSFGDLSFDGHVLRHKKKGELSIAEIESVSVGSNGYIYIRKIGKRLAWANVQMGSLDNPIVLFDRLNDRSIKVDMSEEVFLPHPTIAMLANAATARANLPKAVIHHR